MKNSGIPTLFRVGWFNSLFSYLGNMICFVSSRFHFDGNIYLPLLTNSLSTSLNRHPNPAAFDDYRKKFRFGDTMNIDYFLRQCEDAYSGKDYRRTVELCDEVLKRDLNNQTALGYKAKCLYLLGEFEDDLRLLENAITIYPNNYRYFSIRAEVLMEMGEYDKAIECFERAFEIGVGDDDGLSFMKMHYETCINLKIELLMEREKYVDAWEYYERLCEIESDNLERTVMIGRFKRIVRELASKNKSRHYCIRFSTDEAKLKLFKFLRENGFEGENDCGLLLLIDVVGKTYSSLSPDDAGDRDIISESKFYDKVNYCPRGEIVYRKLHDEDGNLVYEGLTLDYSPYGFGKAYFANGKLYRDGIFDIKGIVQGKEYYPSGRLRFEGQWCLTGGYGPNAPCEGDAYNENGELIYSGKFEIKRGGVGWPMIQKPKGFALEQKERPKIEYH